MKSGNGSHKIPFKFDDTIGQSRKTIQVLVNKNLNTNFPWDFLSPLKKGEKHTQRMCRWRSRNWSLVPVAGVSRTFSSDVQPLPTAKSIDDWLRITNPYVITTKGPFHYVVRRPSHSWHYEFQGTAQRKERKTKTSDRPSIPGRCSSRYIYRWHLLHSASSFE